MPPQPTGTTSTSGDAVTDCPQMTKDKTGTRSVCKRLFCGTESNSSSRDSFLCAQGSTSTQVNQPLDAVLVGGLQQSISASFVNGCRIGRVQQGLDRETTLLRFENIPPSLPNTWQKQEQALLGHGRIFMYSSQRLAAHTHTTTGQMCHYRTNDS